MPAMFPKTCRLNGEPMPVMAGAIAGLLLGHGFLPLDCVSGVSGGRRRRTKRGVKRRGAEPKATEPAKISTYATLHLAAQALNRAQGQFGITR